MASKLEDLNIDWLRNNVGIVQQEPVLFNATIEENLRIGKPDIGHEKMVEVCKMANAHDFIMKLPKVLQAPNRRHSGLQDTDWRWRRAALWRSKATGGHCSDTGT